MTTSSVTSSTFSGFIQNGTGTVALTKAGSGTLTLSGANTYTGGTTLGGGELSLGSSGAIGSTSGINFNGGTLQWTSSNVTDYSSLFTVAAGQAYSLDTNGQGVTLASALTASGDGLDQAGQRLAHPQRRQHLYRAALPSALAR